MRYRLIAPKQLNKPIFEYSADEITNEELKRYNENCYNVYYFPNDTTNKEIKYLKGKDVDLFQWVFIDMDLKDKKYASKQEFAEFVKKFPLKPSKTIITGHGVHVYWQIEDLDGDKYMGLQKRLLRYFNTDNSIWTLLQPMRVEGFFNTKDIDKENWILVKRATDPDLNTGSLYNVADFDKVLPPLTDSDKKDIDDHKRKVFKITEDNIINEVSTELPEKFVEMLKKSQKLHKYFYEPEDRSVCDMKIANVLQGANFDRKEAIGILLQTDKGKERGISYVQSIVDKVYDNPMDSLDYDNEMTEMVNSQDEITARNRENFEYKVLKENERVRRAKEVDKKRGKFNLRDSVALRRNRFLEDTQKDIQSIGKELPFICPKLTKAVALSPHDYIFIGGNTGLGKSSVAANIIMPVVDAGKKVLVLSTEESQSEIIKRCMALSLKYDYNDERSWTAHQRMKCVEQYDKFADRLVVVDYMFETDEGVRSELTTLEGLENVLTCAENDGYDLIVVDYLTKITTSSTNPALNFYTVVDSAAKFLEEFNKKTRIPVIAFGQIKGDTDMEFKERIRNAKSIMEYVTSAIEISTDREANLTTLIFHKMRKMPPNFEGKIDLEFDKGRYKEI